jgi:tetratricopeptide (TPR) repeat protein
MRVVAAVIAAAVPLAARATPEPPPPPPSASSPAPASASQLAIPRPDLSALAPVARRKVEALQKGLEDMLAAREADAPMPVPLAAAFGFLGQIYHAVELPAAAQESYRQATELAPEDPVWRYLRGLARNAQGDLAGAVEDYRAALAISPDDLAARLRLGQALLELGRADEAREAFAAVLARNADSAAAHFGLGRASAAPAEAIEHFDRALALDPAATAVHYPLAQAHRRLGREEEARRHLARQGSREPELPDPAGAAIAQIQKSIALEVLVELAAQEEGFEEPSFLAFAGSRLAGSAAAVDALAQVLAKLPAEGAKLQRGRLHAARGTLLARLGRDEDAAAELERALALAPALRATAREHGDALARLGRWDDAAAAYSHALAGGGEDVELLSRRALARVNAGQLVEARADLESLVALQPTETAHRVRLAAVLARAGELQAARAALETAVSASDDAPARAAAQEALGDFHRSAGELAPAATAYEAALSADPQRTSARLALAGLLGLQGRYQEAAAAYGRLLESDPKHVAARVGQASALIFLGEHASARAVLEEGLRLAPDAVPFKDVLARHLAACPDRAVRDGARAVALAEDLYRAVPSTESAETLAMAYAEAGQFDEAVRWQRELVEQLGDETAPETVARWRRHLDLYERRQACCG